MNRTEKYLNYLIGQKSGFTPEHQFFNATCIITVITALLASFLILFGVPLAYLSSLFSVVVLVIYYFSRIKGIYNNILLCLFSISVLFFLSVTWFLNSGTKGGVLFFYLATICFILFMTERWIKIMFVLLFIINISFLFWAEKTSLLKIQQYHNAEERLIDIYADFILVSLVLAFVIGNIRRLYYQEKKNTVTLIEEFRKHSENLKKELDDKISVLSIKEREILQLIIEGKSNKEIASYQNVSLGTVKTHINNMYKKLGAKKRTDIMSMATIDN